MSASLVLLVPDRPVVVPDRPVVAVFRTTTTNRLDRTHARDTGREQALRFPGRTQGRAERGGQVRRAAGPPPRERPRSQERPRAFLPPG